MACCNFASANNEVGFKLMEYHLIPIFRNGCITTNDLLNYRLVNRRWKNAATSVLKHRTSCKIYLRKQSKQNCPVPASFIERNSKVYCCAMNPSNSILDLIDLIRESQNFPCTGLCFLNGYSVRRGNPIVPDFQIKKFFSFYGKQIKHLSICGKISFKDLCDLVQVRLPNLQSLDLSQLLTVQGLYFSRRQTQNQESLQKIRSLPKLNFVSIKTLRLRSDPYDDRINKIQQKLICAARFLQHIENADVCNLEVVIRSKTTHLMKSLYFEPTAPGMPVNFYCGFTLLHPKHLQKLALNLIGISKSNTFEINAINLLLESNRTTLKFLVLHNVSVELSLLVEIPSLTSLQILGLIDNPYEFRSTYHLRNYFEKPFFTYNMPNENSFPKLRQVQLNLNSFTVNNHLLSIFYPYALPSKTLSHLKVETLQISTTFALPTSAEEQLLYTLFPNVKSEYKALSELNYRTEFQIQ